MLQRANVAIFISICLVILLSSYSLSLATMPNNAYEPRFKPEVTISQKTGDIKIDGHLHDPGWAGAAMIDHFVENEPGDQIKPPVDTKAYLTYDKDYLYVSIVCYDNPEDIRATLCERDQMYSDDNVGFFFDTYGDASWAYTMNVNPYGVQADAIWTNGFGEDSKYDLVWESAGQITDSGYQVEIAIPFSTLRFPNKPEQNWRIEFWRHHYRDVHYNLSWCAYDRNEPCWACQWGYLKGIKDVQPGKGIEIIPAFVGYQSGFATELDAGTPNIVDSIGFENEDADGEIALNIKYSPVSNITIEGSYNPDFSQVEADADQIDVNTTTALWFPEKRPFFQEGSDLFKTIFDAVYTRTINDPDFASKFTARINRTSIAVLSAHDEHTPILMPFEERSKTFTIGKSYNNFVRIRQAFGENSQFGALITDRRYEGGGSGSAFSLDGSFRLSQKFRLMVQSIASYTEEPDDSLLTSGLSIYDKTVDSSVAFNQFYYDADRNHTAGFDGESFWGHSFIALLDYSIRDLYISSRLSEISENFRAENGYLPRNDRRQASIVISKDFRADHGLIKTISPQFFAARIWNMDGQIKDEWINIELPTYFRKWQSYMHLNLLLSRENYGGRQFDNIWGIHNCFQVQGLSKNIQFGGSVDYGNRIARNDFVMGRELQLSGWVDVRLFSRLLSEFNYSYIQSRNSDTDDLLYLGYILRNKISLQLNRELSIRLVTQFNQFNNAWDIDPLITYRLSPFSLFYIGTTYDYIRYDNYQTIDNSTYKLAARQFFMKLQYMFQI
ncbi:MAG: carbohydrate binding family 9 domain-containing protein [Candidatus Zixiibacteriota bacterium]